jgi:hypothetical protein
VRIGIRMRQLWRLKLGMGLSLALALLVAIWSVEKISLLPPGLSSRSGLEMATAHTEVLVDTPQSIMTNLRVNSDSIDGLVNRAVVLGNVIASTPVETRIAQRAHVPAALLRIQAPLTPKVASLPVSTQSSRSVTDILKSNEQYRIAIDANPIVPMLDIYAQTPTAESAAALANAAVDELKAYLAGLASTQATPAKYQIRLEELGRATGTVINPGVKYQVALLVFILTFLLACASTIFISRIRAGWRLEALADRTARA